MLGVLDRYILRSLILNYGITLAVMISLYFVLDMFVNMDEFTEQGYPPLEVLANMADYYWPNLFMYFTQLSGVITLFACMSTIARLRTSNEVTAVLASGVSLYRLAAPIILFGLSTTTLHVACSELILPRVAHKLSRDHDDADGKNAYEVLFLPDRNGALLSASRFHPIEHDMQNLLVMTRDEDGTVIQTLEADHAQWEPPNDRMPVGRWKLTRSRLTTRVFHDHAGLGPREDKQVSFPAYYESNLGPREIQLRQAQGWVQFLSLRQLRDMLADETADVAAIVQTRHKRIAAPIVSVVLLLLGLPFFLDRSPANVLGDAGKCMIACGLCYVVTFVSQSIRQDAGSALPNWIPIFIFATVATVLIDRIKT